MCREFVFCAWVTWEMVLPLSGVRKSVDRCMWRRQVCLWWLGSPVSGALCSRTTRESPEPALSVWPGRSCSTPEHFLILTPPPLQWVSVRMCVCVLGILLPLSFECRDHVCATMPDPLVSFLGLEVSSSFVWILFSHTGFLLLFSQPQPFSPPSLPVIPPGSFDCGRVGFRLLPFPTYNFEQWYVVNSVIVSKARLEIFRPKVLGCCFKTCVRVTPELSDSLWHLLFRISSGAHHRL